MATSTPRASPYWRHEDSGRYDPPRWDTTQYMHILVEVTPPRRQVQPIGDWEAATCLLRVTLQLICFTSRDSTEVTSSRHGERALDKYLGHPSMTPHERAGRGTPSASSQHPTLGETSHLTWSTQRNMYTLTPGLPSRSHPQGTVYTLRGMGGLCLRQGTNSVAPWKRPVNMGPLLVPDGFPSGRGCWAGDHRRNSRSSTRSSSAWGRRKATSAPTDATVSTPS
jgi:hypothetical protein